MRKSGIRVAEERVEHGARSSVFAHAGCVAHRTSREAAVGDPVSTAGDSPHAMG